MTGYASVEATLGGRSYRLHAKSVNHRYLETKWRAPRAWMTVEAESKAALQKILSRGSLEIVVETIGEEGRANTGARQLFEELNRAIESTRGGSLRLPAFVKALVLARFPDAWRTSSGEESPLDPKEAAQHIERLAQALAEARSREGERLCQVLNGVAKRLEELLAVIDGQSAEIQKTARETLRTRLADLARELQVAPATEGRIAQELSFLAEKRDVAEEIARIRIHLEALRALLGKPADQAGKRLDFLGQELHREWTTLGNKVQEARLSEVIIDAKLEIDRLKEQAANVV